jgi:hypothetical protein
MRKIFIFGSIYLDHPASTATDKQTGDRQRDRRKIRGSGLLEVTSKRKTPF